MTLRRIPLPIGGQKYFDRLVLKWDRLRTDLPIQKIAPSDVVSSLEKVVTLPGVGPYGLVHMVLIACSQRSMIASVCNPLRLMSVLPLGDSGGVRGSGEVGSDPWGLGEVTIVEACSHLFCQLLAKAIPASNA